jgi:hypothetical protein
MPTVALVLTRRVNRRRPHLALAAYRHGSCIASFWSPDTEMLQMKYMHKAIWQSDGNLVIRGNTRALLFRALEDAKAELAQRDDGDQQLARTLAALHEVLGSFDGKLPTANELLGDPVKDRVSRNLLKC